MGLAVMLAVTATVTATVTGGCAAPAAALKTAPPPPPAAPPPGTEVEKMREQLQVAPWDLVLCAARGAGSVDESVTARNLTEEPVEVRAIFVTGEEGGLFRVANLPALPATLAPKGSTSVSVILAAPAATRLGVHRALLRFQTGPTPDDGPGVDLAALVTLGREGPSEPPLEQVVEALGDGKRRSDEVDAPLFQRASAAPVAVNPVARFSADGTLPFGHYEITGSGAGEAVNHEMARLVAGQNQTLNPDLEPGGQTSFDPGDAPFGLWVKSGKRMLYSEDARNGGVIRHAARIFPLRARGGAPVPNAYLVAFEESTDGDYQDCVFVLWNVKPAAMATAKKN
jgi:hypothetical protein